MTAREGLAVIAACILGILIVKLCTGCEGVSTHYSIDADTPELQAMADDAYAELKAEGYELKADVTMQTVDSIFDGHLGVTYSSGHVYLIQVVRPYERDVVYHELGHACGEDWGETAGAP